MSRSAQATDPSIMWNIIYRFDILDTWAKLTLKIVSLENILFHFEAASVEKIFAAPDSCTWVSPLATGEFAVDSSKWAPVESFKTAQLCPHPKMLYTGLKS